MSTKIEARVSVWFEAKNWGFIHQNRDGKLVSFFFHRKHLIEGIPAAGKIARFNPVQEAKSLVAHDVEIIDDAAAFDVLANSTKQAGGAK